ncbi:branched-chain amino acid ABC transporter permease [Achromobacter xylosoxidans]|jgi:branched-chain amino acid transport system permease protein|uniref:branched-chain amino acid ABC transporter permease n=1 Tax=Alcaligenes xylosoxydans xylosoxydans TaxID=85698 RepID=UPI0003321065|nr:branched-chain amino acid ABC transporter permease [Achromobacter xylosoxidans]KAA5920853.1 branched-chain amino acid ABC transporter permease [Achromobacter xylosoxidans]KMJ88462.1 ABC transporter permease [Achromobacter xylosoxidans]KOQ29852.1 ABC transporter permease [Achromobacter xylosoxidans]KOQ29895.1 ABC transporter permease [Achromobacter xylosoxidans]KOQ35114.1 ABC transporter permease [Achromobacter xylosoxidans]
MSRKTLVNLAGLALFALVPALASATGEAFLVNLMTRFLIYAIAAVSLDLILGYGAMVSFGHAAFFGLGGYVIGIAGYHFAQGDTLFGWSGSQAALVMWPLAVACAALAGLVVGFLSLRTAGVQFIMITLAFGQMLYFILVGLVVYGGDDGLSIDARNTLPGLDLNGPVTFYYVCLALLAAWVLLCRRIVNSPFGMALQSLRQNPRRSTGLGLAPLRYRLTAFVLSAAGAGLAGALWANYALFVSPDMAGWQKSGELMAMVILGGMGSIFGPVLGVAVYLGLEQLATAWTEHWMLILGPVLVLVVLFGKRGVYGWLTGGAHHD